MANDYADALYKLLPNGRAWDFDVDSNNYKLITGLSKIFNLVDEKIANIIYDMIPTTSNKKINDWLRLVGLNNLQIASIPSLKLKQFIAVTLFVYICYFTIKDAQKIADTLNLKLTLKPFDPFNASKERAGDRLSTDGWDYVLYVDIDDADAEKITVIARAGRARAGDRLLYRQNKTNNIVDIFLLILTKKLQAHITPITNYYRKHA